ncbi:response regulator transcription factor [Sulfoacidibacillus thermotolerans]|uniref:DNA-binding response regulator n=1 Tax=Sulfoacidibacillus thermotolerans TaxID=1765684 RepID=A0A2U3D7M8_SULT2|nr:response regulator transcription factor [Sulfoacidibacillus thermotolerans]PWI57287.1 DNA-binding response regulator [Sulfoacidibacillus thermotolerans]
MAERVLVVDDEEAIRTLVEYNLRMAGYEVETAEEGFMALELIAKGDYDLLVLDLMLPGVDGLELCKRLRQTNSKIPIIMLTARGEEIDRVLGLEMGADDYVTKPFSPRELVARVRAVLRRKADEPVTSNSVEADSYTIGDVHLDASRYEVTVRGELIELTPREFELLHYLLKNLDRVVSRDQLLDGVWGYEYAGDTRLVDVHISHLRDKIEDDPKNPRYIKTVRGVGYKFVRGE